jgi:hypothetical protein
LPKPPLPLLKRSMMLIRRASADIASHIEQLVRAAGLFSDRTAFRVRRTRTRTLEFRGSREEIETALEESRLAARAERDEILALGTSAAEPLLILTYLRDTMVSSRQYDTVDIAFNLERPLVGSGGHFSFGELLKFFAVLVDAFDAGTGSIGDSQLLQLIGYAYTQKALKAQLSRAELKQVSVPDIVQAAGPEIVARISRLQHPTSFNVLEAPAAVRWINYWGPRQVRAVGPERIRKAPWGFQAEHPGGGMLLASQEVQFDALNLQHLERIAAIVDAIALHEVQKKHQKPGSPLDRFMKRK